MTWIAIRMLTGDRQKFFGLLFGVAFSALLISQQLTIFVNLVSRGATAVYNVPTGNVWVMDPVSRTVDVTFAMPATALDKVRSVKGVDWAVPMLRASANVRTPQGDLEGVAIVGVDDATLIGLPSKITSGTREAMYEPDAIFIDEVGATKLFGEGVDPLGMRLELNDRRAIIRGVVNINPTFTSQVTLFTRYSNALSFIPGSRNRMTFVLAQSGDGLTPGQVAARVAKETGLRARTRDEFAQDGIDFIIQNTGIPINFGITVFLGVIVGIAIVGLTFSLFIRDNIKQFGALKAIGVTNNKIRMMVAAQALLVGLIGYGFGILGAVVFIYGNESQPSFKGFYVPWQIPVATAVVVLLMILLTGWLALRSVLKTEPAEVFR
jgi:putative ABC transport system permease protein